MSRQIHAYNLWGDNVIDSLAEELVEEHIMKRPDNSKGPSLIGKVLEIYDQKFVAELLRSWEIQTDEETLNRWINGKRGHVHFRNWGIAS